MKGLKDQFWNVSESNLTNVLLNKLIKLNYLRELQTATVLKFQSGGGPNSELTPKNTVYCETLQMKDTSLQLISFKNLKLFHYRLTRTFRFVKNNFF